MQKTQSPALPVTANVPAETYRLPYDVALLHRDEEICQALDQLQQSEQAAGCEYAELREQTDLPEQAAWREQPNLPNNFALPQRRPWLALDTERTQQHYQELITLIQLKSENTRSFLIDLWQLRSKPADDTPTASPGASSSVSSVQTPSASTPVGWEEKLYDVLQSHTCILQDASTDLPFLYEESLYPAHLFDTQIAARLLGYEKYGLGALVEAATGHRLAKNHANERWEQRPLPPDWLEYAALDVEFLIPVAEKLQSELADCGRLEWAEQEFSHLLNTYSHYCPPDPTPWLQIKGAAQAKGARAYTLLVELWNLRDTWASERDQNPRRIFSDRALLDFAVKPVFTKRDAVARGGLKTKNAYQLLGEIASTSRYVSRLPEKQLLLRPRTALVDNRNLCTWERYYPEQFKALMHLKAQVRTFCESLADGNIDPSLALPGRDARQLAIALAAKQPLPVALAHSALRPWQQNLLTNALARN